MGGRRIMGLSVYLMRTKWVSFDKGVTYTEEREEVHWNKITHNLIKMAIEAGLYKALWRPYQLIEGYNIPEDDDDAEYVFERENKVLAKDIIPHLEKGLKELKERPEHYKKFNPDSGWGNYEGLVEFTENYLEACREYPETEIETDR
jgi:hypothetical protein